MSALPVLLLVLAPFAREPVGGADRDRIEDPLERRVNGLLAGEAIQVGIAAVVPLHARVPSEAGHGRPARVRWADDRLVARLLVEDGQAYLRVINPTDEAMFLAAGTLFARDGTEVAVARDAVIPANFAALVPAGPLGPWAEATDLARAGRLPPPLTGGLLAGPAAFRAALDGRIAIRGDDRLVPVLRSGAVRKRAAALAAALDAELGGAGGTLVGVVFLVRDRPVAAHVFARHDLLVAALPHLLQGLAVAVHDDELRNGRPPAAWKHLSPRDARSVALGWLRGAVAERAPWGESYGAGFETLAVSANRLSVCHAVVDQQRGLVHAGFHAVPALPPPDAPVVARPPNPPPPGNPDETPTGVRERRPRQTVEEERRGDLNPNPGPSPGGAGGTPPQRPDPGQAGGGRPR